MVSQRNLGFGLGLRTAHYNAILDDKPTIDWFEILTENYLVPGGKPHYYLEKIREHYPMTMHGVSMSIGSSDPLDWDYLTQVKTLAQRIEPAWISDHLCWTGIYGKNTHDLLPLPYTEEAVKHIANRIIQIQDFLGQRLLIENISTYLSYHDSVLKEWDFLKEICKRADCLILLDINNLYVNSINHEFDALEYLTSIPTTRICQIHLAGHSTQGNCIIDTHDQDIINPVWNLYEKLLTLLDRPVATMIERDDNIPPIPLLLSELNHARKISERVFKVPVA
jgi:uncharacterized protein (UPF0276 family)